MKYCLLFLSAIFIIASCKKTEVPASKQDVLRGSGGTTWRMDTATITYRLPAGNDTTTSAWGNQQRPTCKFDDFLIFRDGNIGALNTGDLKCPNGETQEIATKWGITDNDTKMYIYDAGDMFFGADVNAELADFSDSKFILKFPLYNVTFNNQFIVDTVHYTVTMKKR